MPDSPALAGKKPIGGRATAYVCSGAQCSAPLTEPDELRQALLAMRRQRTVSNAPGQ
jgi:uncharacterized protein YyaL (SSP411 family)